MIEPGRAGTSASTKEDLPEQAERERRYLTHAELLMLAKAADRFDALTLVLCYCGSRFCEAVALRRKHVGDRVLTVRSSATAVTGIEGLVPHGLLHTTASLAISAGANVKVVQRLLGHATAALTLDRYGHLLDDDLSGVADALAKAIDSTAVSLRYLKRSEEAGAAENPA